MSTARERPEEISKRIKREGGDVTEQLGRRHLHVGAGHSSLNTATPCAACKLLRRRCALECPFSPYFSPHEPHKFASVHKVFGASNVSKMLMEVPENQRADAANSLVYEANIRIRDPIYGCMGAISTLQHQVRVLEAELNAVRGEILKHKYRHGGSAALPAPLIAPGEAVSVTAVAPQIVNTVALPPVPTTSSSSSIYGATPNSASTAYSSISNGNVAYLV